MDGSINEEVIEVDNMWLARDMTLWVRCICLGMYWIDYLGRYESERES